MALDIWGALGRAGQDVLDVPKSLITGNYQGQQVPNNIRFMGAGLVGGTITSGASLATKMFGTGGGSVAISKLPSWTPTAAVGAGAAIGGYLFGKGRGSAPQAQQQQQQAGQNQGPITPTVNNFNQQYNNSRQYTFNDNSTHNYSSIVQNVINSPNASVGAKMPISQSPALNSNPSMTQPVTQSTPVQMPFNLPQSLSQGQAATQQQGMDWATIAAILGVALVAYGYTSRKGGKGG